MKSLKRSILESLGEVIPNFQQHAELLMAFQTSVQVYHFASTIEKFHRQSGELYNEIGGLIDRFIEVGSGTNRIDRTKNLPLMSGELMNILSETLEKTPSIRADISGRPDLLAILDEFEAVLNKNVYLSTMN